VKEVFEALDKAEGILTGKDYLVANRLTEADIRLWVTIVSFSMGFFSDLKNQYAILRFDSTQSISAISSATFEASATSILQSTSASLWLCSFIVAYSDFAII